MSWYLNGEDICQATGEGGKFQSLSVLGTEQCCSTEIDETLHCLVATFFKVKGTVGNNFDTIFYLDIYLK